ncbi:TIGR04222 domain-containing membrane protein [Nocardiopsis sp. NRRL B-16309]|uniref:TIGR04222 domain-containing membrane protein n=1 Tax=Nocardiopsis sp. NRRL B-16309 TaxID=1519494 RepID=UPI0009EA56DC|nr:TIGR04222 domain-containing membrane protein [Nocardiopsis sp. NRRL B-16309]
MDGSTVVSLVIAVVAGLAVGAVPLLTVLRSRAALNAAIGRTPAVSPPDPDDLDPEELAYLAGGPVRVAETVVMELHLSGRIRHQAAQGFFTLVGPSTPYTHEKSLIRRTIIRGYRDRTGLTAREMIRRAMGSGGMIAIADGLKASRLRVDAPGLSRLLASREKVPSRIRWMRALSLLVGVAAGVFHFLVEPGAVSLGFLVGGFVALVALSVAKAVLDATGGATLLATTPAGRAVVAQAGERYEVEAQSTAELDRAVAVRFTAVTGFRALRGVATATTRTRPARRHTSPAPGSSGGTVNSGGAESTIDDGVRLQSLCAFAETCQGETGGAGSSSGGDGWGGSFSGGGDVSGGSDSGGGGWSFGGGDGGSGGGGDGGGGGGGGD